MRILLTVDYAGTAYAGWQVQPGQTTVQGELERAAQTLTGVRTPMTASGRTDAGVHALAQKVHFDTEKAWDTCAFIGGLNRYLPSDIRVLSAERVNDDFHARFSAKRKTYVYRMYRSSVERAVYNGRALRVDPDLDVRAMRAAAARLTGRHDFTSFRAANSDTATSERTIFSAAVEERGTELYFIVTADGFLYNMVRIMTGVLLRAGRNELTADDVDGILAARDRTRARDTAPAYGLYLFSVEYA